MIGDPLEVFTNALFTTLAHIKNADINIENIEFRFSQAEIVCMYSDIEDDEEQQQLLDTWKAICTHCGGVIEYLNKRMWTVNYNDITLSCQPEGFLIPAQAYHFIEEDAMIKSASANKSVSKISFSTCYDVNGKNFIMIFSGNSMRLILGIKILANYVYKIFARIKRVFTFRYLK